MKQFKSMQSQFDDIKKQMETATATGTSSGGLVSITLNGNHEMTSIKIKPDCVDKEDVEGLEDLIREAYKNANASLSIQMNSSMGGLGGGFL